MPRTMPAKPNYLRATTIGRPVGVDRKNNVLRGYVVAQLGPFKSQGRGEFDLQSLKDIVAIGNASTTGLKSRFTHPDMSSDGLGKHLGRSTNFSLGTALDARTKEKVPAVRADLAFNKTAMETPPNGGRPYGEYVMSLAETDPDAISSSLVVNGVDFFLRDKRGLLMKVSEEEIGDETPIWRPTILSASDIVDTGDAVDGLLSADWDGLPLKELWQASQMLDGVFAGQSRDVVESRLNDYVQRYLNRVYGEPVPLETPKLDRYRKALMRMEAREEWKKS